jgi:hypothetical protein
MNVSFSAQTHCNCDTCGLRANHGFFAHHDDDLDSEIFICTGCAQKEFPPSQLESAIDSHRQICFERAEAESKENEVILAWLSYEEEGALAC